VVYVPQRYRTDCGIACFAMILDLPYECVFKIAFHEEMVDLSFGLEWQRCDNLLDALNIRRKYLRGDRVNIATLKHRSMLCLKVKDGSGLLSHGVVWDPATKTIYDPAGDKQTVCLCQDRLILAVEILGNRKWYHSLWA
jgi:ABC-type bacteriocin/lantibiotic exporter with double-glycine peptidase domain